MVLPTFFKLWCRQLVSSGTGTLLPGLTATGWKVQTNAPSQSSATLLRGPCGDLLFLIPRDVAPDDPDLAEMYYVDDLNEALVLLTKAEISCGETHVCPWGPYFEAKPQQGGRFYVYQLHAQYRPL